MTPEHILEAARPLIALALAEDVGAGDATTDALVPTTVDASAAIIAREPCILAGHDIAANVFRAVSQKLTYTARIEDGQHAEAGAVVARISGPAHAMLTAERTALNFLQRLTGIATQTGRFVDAVAAHRTQILDTRKTTPGYRALEKYAVQCGGGANHRMGLYDRVMIKDNHRALRAEGQATADLAEAVHEARKQCPGLAVEVEVETDAEFETAMRALPEWILLDNMPPERMRDYVMRAAGRVKLEASGGITLDNVRAVAASGVDAISLGCLTHSVKATDLSMEIA